MGNTTKANKNKDIQKDKFEDTAKSLECDQSDDALNKALSSLQIKQAEPPKTEK